MTPVAHVCLGLTCAGALLGYSSLAPAEPPFTPVVHPAPASSAVPLAAPTVVTSPAGAARVRPPGNVAMRNAGIVITTLGILSVPVGLTMIFAPVAPGGGNSINALDRSPGFFLGAVMLPCLGSTILPAIGIPLWVNGAKPANPAYALDEPHAKWSLAPLMLSRLQASAAHAPPPPAGISLVGTW